MIHKKTLCILVALLMTVSLCPVSNAAEQASSFTANQIKTEAIESFQYWLYTPGNPTENMPLIVYLHGGSGKGSDLSLITGVEGFPKYLQTGQLGDLRAYVIMPQLPADQKGWPGAGSSLMQLISHMETTYGVDPDNISLTGHSMGGTGTWSVALSYPTTFARIAPLSGSVRNNDLNLKKLKDIPVRAFVGSADTIVDPAASVEFVAALQDQGSDAQLVNFSGASHFDVPALTYLDTSLGLLDWLIDAETEEQLQLETEQVALRCDAAGVYYKCRFVVPDSLRSEVSYYGIALGVGKHPAWEDGTYVQWEQWSDRGYSVLVSDILEEENGTEKNRVNAQVNIVCIPYVQWLDGTRTEGTPVSYSLQALFEGTETTQGIDDLWDTLSTLQKESVIDFCDRFSEVVEDWHLPNILGE